MSPLKKTLKKIQTGAKTTRMTLLPVKKSPDELLGELFELVQLQNIHADGKTFVDQVPSARLRSIAKTYEKQSQEPGFDLKQFVDEHFSDYLSVVVPLPIPTTDDPEEHILHLWDVLTREAPEAKGSLIPLPGPYIVPGGRFQEQFYWDSYFIMLGLEASGRHDLTDSIMANFGHMFRKFGFIPTGNRTYFTSRSQPPYYLQMIRLIAHRKGHHRYLIPRLPFLLQEYAFWTQDNSIFLTMNRQRYKRSVRMPNGDTLQRYYDAKNTPRPESYKEDVETGEKSEIPHEIVYRHLRAGAESGWDFSSRWFKDGKSINTVQTTDLVPVDLNCMLYELELGLAEAHNKLFQLPIAMHYRKKAKIRKATINECLWDEKAGFYFDYNFVTNERSSDWTLAGMHPLYCGVASPEQAARVARNIEKKFLKLGGVQTTLKDTGEQWDAPNGWAPLQWITIIGLRRYGFDALADTIKERWLATNAALFRTEHKFVEKYNVVEPTKMGGGGEYVLQDGFGWTNGVFIALKRNLDVIIAEKIKIDD